MVVFSAKACHCLPSGLSFQGCLENNSLETQKYCLPLGQRTDLFPDQYNKDVSLWDKGWAYLGMQPTCKSEDFLSLGFLGCGTNQLMPSTHLDPPPHGPHDTWGTRRTNANVKLKLPPEPLIIKSVASDPGISGSTKICEIVAASVQFANWTKSHTLNSS